MEERMGGGREGSLASTDSCTIARRSLLGWAGLALAGCGGRGGRDETPPGSEVLVLGLPAAPSPWQRELQDMANLVMAWHPRPFAYLPREQFVEQARALMARLPALADDTAYLALMQLLSGLRDGHCFLQFPWRPGADARALPFSVFAFEEGLFITGVEPGRSELADLSGAEVLAYGTQSATESLRRAARYLPAENDCMALHYGAQALRSGLVMADAGLSDSPAQVRLSLRRPDGSRIERQLATGALQELSPGFVGEPARPLRRPELDFWAEWLDDAWYLRYRRCRDAAGFEQLMREQLSAPRMASARRVVVDLRGNGGGDSRVVAPLIDGLRMLGLVGTRLAVLSDRGTLSAAVDALLDLRGLGARHVGEAPGQRPNFNGNARQFSTGSGRLQINLPTTYQPRVTGDPEQVVPDLLLPQRVADWRVQRDVALDAALTP